MRSLHLPCFINRYFLFPFRHLNFTLLGTLFFSPPPYQNISFMHFIDVKIKASFAHSLSLVIRSRHFACHCKSPRCQNSVLYYLFEFRVNRLHKQIQQQHTLLLRVSCKNITLHHSSSVPIPICIFCPWWHQQSEC